MDAKFERLSQTSSGKTGLLVAFSAGVDSTFLLKAAHMALGERAIALTASSPYGASGRDRCRQAFAASLGCRHIVLDSHELDNPSFAQNPANRCFFCKDELYRICRAEADKLGIETIVDGTNLDDLQDHRPGLKAANEWGVRHPLVEAEMTKDDIRRYSRELIYPHGTSHRARVCHRAFLRNGNQSRTAKQIGELRAFYEATSFSRVSRALSR